MTKLQAVLTISAILTLSGAAPQNPASKPAQHSAIKPDQRLSEDWWKQRHEAANARAKKGGVDLLFIGDSITQGWEGEGAEAWKKYYEKRNPLNLGFSGDRTQHVLWRFENGNITGIAPKAAVIMIGTNNSNGNDNTVAEIADGITEIVKTLRAKLPKMKILLLGIFPRGDKPNPQRDKINDVNKIVSKLDDGKSVYYLDIAKQLMAADGAISKDIMPDFLHLSKKGYEIWAESIEKKLAELMK